MKVQEALNSKELRSGDKIELIGWLVDRFDGLFILGSHYPEDYDYPERIKIRNGNIMHSILKQVSTLVGGKSKLFYKAKVIGRLVNEQGVEIIADELYTQDDRNVEELFKVEIGDDIVNKIVAERGDYQFEIQRSSARDWLDDL